MFKLTIIIFVICVTFTKTIHADLCWTFTTCADTSRTASISVDEHTSVGDIIWQGNATETDGSDANAVYVLTGYEKPTDNWTCLVLSDGALSVTDSVTLDYETLTNGSDSTPPHAILLITATDPSNNNYTNASIEITLVDIPEMPVFTTLPGTIVLPENQTLSEEIYQANYTDPDIYLGETYSFSLATDPTSAPFTIDQTTGIISVDADPCFDYDTEPTYSLFVVLSDGTFTVVGTLTVNISDHPNYTLTFDNLPNTANVTESNPTGTAIFTVQTSDGNPCDVIRYDLVTANVPFALDSTTGQLTTTGPLDYESMTSYNLTINASDVDLTTATETLTVYIGDVDEAPSISVEPSSISVNESETAGLVLFTVDYSDPENTTLTPVLFVTPTGPVSLNIVNDTSAEILLDSNPSLSFETTPSYVVTVTVSDGTFNDSTTVTLIVLDVAEAPTFTNLPGNITIAEESTVPGVPFSVQNADDDNTDVITVALIDTSPATSAFNCSSTGDITVNSSVVFDYEFEPLYTLTIEITDSTGLSVNSTLVVSITDVDEVPVINNLPESVSVSEDSTGAVEIVNVSSTDPEGIPVKHTLSNIEPAGGPFSITAAGVIIIDSNPNFNYDIYDSYNLTVEASDELLTSNSYVTVNILNENRAPQIVPVVLSFNILENETVARVIYTIEFTDEDINDNWIFDIVVTDPPTSDFICNQSLGNISFIDNPGFNFEAVNQYTLNISVTDSTGLVDYQSVTVVIEDVNEAPDLSVTPSSISVAENDTGGTILVTATCQDQEGDELVFDMTSNPAGPFVIDNSSGEISTTNSSDLDFETIFQYNLTITCTDNNTLSDSSVLTVDVTDVAEVPVIPILNNTVSVFENDTGGQVLFQNYATDEDIGDILSYNISAGSPDESSIIMVLFDIDNTTGDVSLQINPNLDYETKQNYLMKIQVTDSTGMSVDDFLIVYVLDVNEEPEITNLPNTTSVYDGSTGGDIVFIVTSTDQENDVLTYSISASDPIGAPFSVNDSGHVTLDDNPGLDHFSVAEYTLSVEASDGFLSDTKNLTVTILNTLDPPEFVNLTADLSVDELTTGLIHTFEFTDPDRENVTSEMTVVGHAANSSFELSTTGELSIVSSGLDYESTSFYTLNVTLTDETGLTTSMEVNVTILDENEAPVFSVDDITISIAEEQATGTVIVTGVISTDVDTIDIAYYNLTGEGALYFDVVTNETTDLVIISRIDRDSPNSVSQIYLGVTVTDKGGLQDTMNITFDITDINDNAPIFDATTLDASLAEDVAIGKLVSEVIVTDIDEGVNQNIVFSEVSASEYLQIDASGRVEVKSDLDYEKQNTIEYMIRATDAGSPQKTSTGTLTLHVIDVHEPEPEFEKTFYSWEIFDDASDGDLAGNVKATSYDGTPVTYSFDVTQDQFSVNSTSGEITIKSSFQTDNKYVIYVAATDTQWFPKSGSTIIRIDTYDQQTYLIDFIIERSLSHFTESYVLTFKQLLKGVIPDSEPRVIFRNNQRWSDDTYFNTSSTSRRRLLQTDTTTLSLLFLKNNDTDSLQNLDSTKDFYTVSTLMQLFTTDETGTPNEYFSSSTFSDYPVTSIMPHVEEEEISENWWLDTTAGLATTITLCVVGAILIGLLILLICVLCKRKNKKKQRVFDPSKEENSAVEKEDMTVDDIPTVYTSPPTYSQVGMAKPWQAPWESYSDREVICKPPPLGDTKRGKNGKKQTKMHSHATDVFDDELSESGSRSITPVSDFRSASQGALSVREVRASLVSPVGNK